MEIDWNLVITLAVVILLIYLILAWRVKRDMKQYDNWHPGTTPEPQAESETPMGANENPAYQPKTNWAGGYHLGCGRPQYQPSYRHKIGYTAEEWATMQQAENAERIAILRPGATPIPDISTPIRTRPTITVSPIERPSLPAHRPAELPAPRRGLPQGDIPEIIEADWAPAPEPVHVRRH